MATAADDTSSVADDEADDVGGDIVRASPLINKAMDDADDKDDIFPTLTGNHVCIQCGRDPPDGHERPVVYGHDTIWLHRECERFFRAKMQERG
jgi:hypothetical protein